MYAEGRFRSGWVGGFAGLVQLENDFESGTSAHLGATFHPGRESWTVRPIIRAGYWLGGDGFMTIGGGVEFGGRFGGEVTADWARAEASISAFGRTHDLSTTAAIIRIGAVYRFGR